MESEVFKLVATQGIFATLFLYLLFYILKENSKREQKYQSIIDKLTRYLPSIQDNIKKIDNKIK